MVIMRTTLETRGRPDFSKRAVLGSTELARHACRDADVALGRRERRSIRHRRRSIDAPEAGRERSEAAEPDREADLGDGAIGVAEQCRRPLEPSRQQVLVRRLTERTTELAAEVRRRELRG